MICLGGGPTGMSSFTACVWIGSGRVSTVARQRMSCTPLRVVNEAADGFETNVLVGPDVNFRKRHARIVSADHCLLEALDQLLVAANRRIVPVDVFIPVDGKNDV